MAALVVADGGSGPAIDGNGRGTCFPMVRAAPFTGSGVRRPLLATRATASCAIAARPNWVSCNGSMAFFIITNDLDALQAWFARRSADHIVQ